MPKLIELPMILLWIGLASSFNKFHAPRKPSYPSYEGPCRPVLHEATHYKNALFQVPVEKTLVQNGIVEVTATHTLLRTLTATVQKFVTETEYNTATKTEVSNIYSTIVITSSDVRYNEIVYTETTTVTQFETVNVPQNIDRTVDRTVLFTNFLTNTVTVTKENRFAQSTLVTETITQYTPYTVTTTALANKDGVATTFVTKTNLVTDYIPGGYETVYLTSTIRPVGPISGHAVLSPASVPATPQQTVFICQQPPAPLDINLQFVKDTNVKRGNGAQIVSSHGDAGRSIGGPTGDIRTAGSGIGVGREPSHVLPTVIHDALVGAISPGDVSRSSGNGFGSPLGFARETELSGFPQRSGSNAQETNLSQGIQRAVLERQFLGGGGVSQGQVRAASRANQIFNDGSSILILKNSAEILDVDGDVNDFE